MIVRGEAIAPDGITARQAPPPAETWEGLAPPYSTIVADPPWPYDRDRSDGLQNPPAPRYVRDGKVWSSGLHAGGKGLDYQSLTIADMTTLPVGDLAARDCRMYLWVTNRYLRDAWPLMESWGFTPAHRLLVWCKKPRATAQITTEFVLMGKRGSPPKQPWHGTTWFDWPLQPVHSQKPDAFMDLVEAWSPGPYVELFARAPRLGWDSWGHGYEILAEHP